MQVVEELGGHPRETPSDQIQTFMMEQLHAMEAFFYLQARLDPQFLSPLCVMVLHDVLKVSLVQGGDHPSAVSRAFMVENRQRSVAIEITN